MFDRFLNKYTANNYLFKINKKSTRKICETLEQRHFYTHWKRFRGYKMTSIWFFIVNFECISHFFLVFLLLALNNKMLAVKWMMKHCYLLIQETFNFFDFLYRLLLMLTAIMKDFLPVCNLIYDYRFGVNLVIKSIAFVAK